MTDDLVDTLSRLPASPGITYRGWSGPVSRSAMTVSAVMPTSADPRVASENFTAERLAAFVTVSGRLIAPLSQHPDEQEIAILPGTLLLSVGTVAVPGLVNDVVLLAESGTAPGLPSDSTELRLLVTQQITDALARPVATTYPVDSHHHEARPIMADDRCHTRSYATIDLMQALPSTTPYLKL
jgi:hypothetical protein